MTVRNLIKLLKTLDQTAIIDMSSDEEGNSFGDISPDLAESKLKKTMQKVYSLYPENWELPEDRYFFQNIGSGYP